MSLTTNLSIGFLSLEQPDTLRHSGAACMVVVKRRGLVYLWKPVLLGTGPLKGGCCLIVPSLDFQSKGSIVFMYVKQL